MLPKYRLFIVAWFTIFAAGTAPNACATMLPPSFLDCVVALGSMQSVPEPGQPVHEKWFTEGTGFFYGQLAKDDPDPSKRQYVVFLVTAKHVVVNRPANSPPFKIRINPKDPSTRIEELDLPAQPTKDMGAWFYHPNNKIDVAVLPVDMSGLRKLGYEPSFFASDVHAANRDKLKSLGVAAGDGIFVLGFPINLAGEQRNYVIVRQGVIARISEMLDRASDTFMADAFVFPGNSGGPVVLKPEVFSIQGTQSNTISFLAGIVLSYHPYNDTAISMQTGQPRVMFQENSGLTDVLPVDFVDEAIKSWRAIFTPDK